MNIPKVPLPIDPLLPECEKALRHHPALILQASPGSGKTTRLPPYLLQSSLVAKKSQIWVLEPRRLAAKFASLRVAEEETSVIGDLIGYHFRFEKKYSDKTRLLYLTEGMLMRRIINNPNLEGVSIVILDEFHERHLHTDLSLSFLSFLQKTTRPDLKLVVMSATLEIDPLKVFLPEAPTVKLESPIFPVETHYLNQDQTQKPLSLLVKESIEKEFRKSSQGDCLVFLPGMKEIRNCESELELLSRKLNFSTFCLHGELAKEEQEKAIQPYLKRKVVLSTNLAETSLTIPGVNCVIDSGLQRTASYSWWTGVPSLATKPSSKASAIQRAGRAGRTGPGQCYRLFTKHDFETRAAFETPEIKRADLAQTVLELKALGIQQTLDFNWFDPPAPSSLESARQLLFSLGALDSATEPSRLTEIGKRMKGFSLHPRISRFLIECERNQCLDRGFHLAALISEGNLNSLDALDELNRPLDPQSRRIQQQMEANFEGYHSSKNSTSEVLSRSLLTAFSDRVAQSKSSQKRSPGQMGNSIEFVLASGGTASLKSGTDFVFNEKSPFVIALDVQEFKRGNFSSVALNSLVSIEESWLYDLSPCPLKETEIVIWDKDKQKLNSYSQILIGQLVIDSVERPIVNENLSFPILLKECLKMTPEKLNSLTLQDWVAVFKNLFPEGEMESLIVRCQLLNIHSKTGLEVTSDNLTQFIKTWFSKKRGRDEIVIPECLNAFKTFMCQGHEHLLETKCPTHLTLPNKKKSEIHYAIDKAPWVESRMQDFFGLTQPPQICEGKVSLTIHLLAPNYRAVQVTSDLKSFWEKHYPAIRKELSRNYPKHSWPENPYVPLPPRPPKKN